MLARHPFSVKAAIFVSALLISASTLLLLFRPSIPRPQHVPPSIRPDEVEVVVASLKSENTSWLASHVGDWRSNIYVVDDPTADLTVNLNKGKEAMVYLTHLIDRYDTLPDVTVFLHAQRFQWHNDDPDYDAVPGLRRLRLDHVRAAGYVNLRCAWVLGCPVEIRPGRDEEEGARRPDGPRTTAYAFRRAFGELLPGAPVPDEVGVPCCSQFAVARDAVRARPRADYVHFRDWLVRSQLPDQVSGRVLEYAWHIIFGKPAVSCPRAGDCYCDVYGICDLKCKTNECEGRYVLPKYSAMPKGWPKVGWHGEERNFTGPL